MGSRLLVIPDADMEAVGITDWTIVTLDGSKEVRGAGKCLRLTDTSGGQDGYAEPAVTIAPGKCLVVYASGEFRASRLTGTDDTVAYVELGNGAGGPAFYYRYVESLPSATWQQWVFIARIKWPPYAPSLRLRLGGTCDEEDSWVEHDNIAVTLWDADISSDATCNRCYHYQGFQVTPGGPDVGGCCRNARGPERFSPPLTDDSAAFPRIIYGPWGWCGAWKPIVT